MPPVCPAAMTKAAGTVADVLSLESVTETPPEPAGWLSVTLPTELAPPATLAGDNETAVIADAPLEPMASTARVAVVVLPAKLAVRFAIENALTTDVVTGNEAPDCPAAMTTVAGSVAKVLSLVSEIVHPVAGAGADSVAKPVALAPPISVPGVTVRLRSPSGVIVSALDKLRPLKDAVMLATWLKETGSVDIGTDVYVPPAAMVTLDGTLAAELSLDKANVTPPAGAGPLISTITATGVPLMMEAAGLKYI